MLFFQLDKEQTIPLYEQLYIGIKNAITTKQLDVGSRLPSKRELAEFFNISQTTVELAYAQLLAEGYIMSKPRIGYFVEEVDSLPIREVASVLPPQQAATKTIFTSDFSTAKIDEDAFPFTIWRKYAKDVLDTPFKHLLQTGERQGELALRIEIANYLHQSRGIKCLPEQIVIGSGTEQLLPMILKLLGGNMRLALENPGYSPIPRAQLEQVAIPIDVDQDGLIIGQLQNSNANIVYVTPSHQFPTGAVLSANRRTQLLRWAAETENRYIIEDDYDSEFRYIGKPIPALQGLDTNDRVIYLSTFTKSLMPSLRVAYFVLPPALVYRYQEHFNYYSSTVPRFEQHILANFMKDGHFAKHLNRMRKTYRKKHDKCIDVFANYYPQITISGDAAGTNMLISFDHEHSELTLQTIAREHGIYIMPLSNYYLTAKQPTKRSFLLGFGYLDLDEIETKLHHLMTVWKISKK
ncbi:PLP-dependent aminotransferase family protein [Solibacillus sp. FSL R7-0668]|uniref:MocR-like pyridoxine biosynthesis transcription factor PdxR n=1 Tax=Solibacillus sp. FSL R7-0668 TaxID=2921688 RepID=UPI0030F4C187